PGPDWPKCENDEHCKADKKDNPNGKDYLCVFGQCQECGKDTDCGAGQRCEKGRCDAFCASDRDCAEGETCNDQGDCVKAPPVAQSECVEHGDCKTGFNCQQGKCVAAQQEEVSQCDQTGRIHF